MRWDGAPRFQQLRRDSGRGNLAFQIQLRVPTRNPAPGRAGGTRQRQGCSQASSMWGGRWGASAALTREPVRLLRRHVPAEPPWSMGVWLGWDSQDGEGEERGGPDWGNWERKTPKSEILAGGRAAEINLLLKQSQEPKTPLGGGGGDSKGTGEGVSGTGPPQGFAAGRARTQLPPGTDFSTGAIPVAGKALPARLTAASACLPACFPHGRGSPRPRCAARRGFDLLLGKRDQRCN